MFSLTDFIPFLLFYVLYKIVITIAKNLNRRKTLKMLLDSNLISDTKSLEAFNLASKEKSDGGKRNIPILTVTLGVMGFSLGMLIAAYVYSQVSPILSGWDRNMFPNNIRDGICTGIPLFLASVGVCVAYFINSRKEK